MKIVIFEDFKNDTSESISSRYEGTRRFLHGDDQVGFPLMREATATTATNDGILEFHNKLDLEINRLDLVLNFSDNGDTTGVGGNAGQLVFFNIFRVFANSSTNLLFQHSPYSGTTWSRDVPVDNVKEIKQIYVIVNYEKLELTVFVDGKLLLNRDHVDSWSFINTGNNNLLIDAVAAGIQNTWMPNFLESLVIISDMPDGQMLDLESLSISQEPLVIREPGTFEYSDVGYVEDVDKGDPVVAAPSIFEETEGDIVYDITLKENTLGTRLYAAGRSDGRKWVQVGGITGGTESLTMHQFVYPPIDLKGEEATVKVSDTRPPTSNGLGLEFYGEVDLISYADLSTLVGLTQGTVNPDAGWLHVRLDGQEMFVAKTSARYSLNWQHIYQAGLVYGTDDEGLFPSGNPVNQLKLVTINNRDYVVRLLKGAEEDPTEVVAGNDPLGSRGSEYSRIIYPLSELDVLSYTGPKLERYTAEQLGFAGNGRSTWVIETNSNNTAQRMWAGNANNISQRAYQAPTTSNANSGWRPVLVPVPDHSAPVIKAAFYYDKDKLFFEPNDLRGVYISDTNDL